MVRKHTNTNGKRGIKSCVQGFGGLMDMVETIDREGDAFVDGPDADTVGEDVKLDDGNSTYKRSTLSAYASLGKAEAHWSIFEAYGELPSAGASLQHRGISSNTPKTMEEALDMEPVSYNEFGAIAEASLCKVGVKAGPAAVELSPNVNTGASVGFLGPIPVSASANFLGFGAGIGAETYVATPLGKIKLSLW